MPSTNQNANDFSFILVKSGYAAMLSKVNRVVAKLEADGRTRGQAPLLRRAWRNYEEELRRIGVRYAQRAEESIKDAEHTSRVRPDTHGGGGPRLGDFIGASAPSQRIPGSVFINDERQLEDQGVGWWWTNELGYSGFVGRILEGVFMPGSHSPNPAERRQHPLFKGRMLEEGEEPTGGKTPHGIIQDPIPERAFVRKGIRAVEPNWHADINRARAKFLSELAHITRPASRGGRP